MTAKRVARWLVLAVAPLVALMLAVWLHVRYGSMPLSADNGPLRPWRWIGNVEAGVTIVLGLLLLFVCWWVRPRGETQRVLRAVAWVALVVSLLPALFATFALLNRHNMRARHETWQRHYDQNLPFTEPGM